MASSQLEYPNLPANHYNNLEPKIAIRLYILNNMDEIINYYNTRENIDILHEVYERNFISNEGNYHSPHFRRIRYAASLMLVYDREYIKKGLEEFANIALENHSPEEEERNRESQLLRAIGVAISQNHYNNEMKFNVNSVQDKYILQMLIRYILKLKVLKIYDEARERERGRETDREREREEIETQMDNYLAENWNRPVTHIPHNDFDDISVRVVVPPFQNGNGKKNKKFLKKSKKKKQKRSKKNKKSKKKRKHKKSKKKKQKKSH